MKMLKKMFFVAFVLFATSLMAQEMPGKCMMKNNLPDLTQEQQSKIEELHVNLMKTMQPLKKELQVLKAELDMLTTSEKVDMNAVNQKIDQIGALKVKMMKEKENHRQAVRKLLNDKQRLIFDAHQCDKHKGNGKMGKEMHRGGNCPMKGEGMNNCPMKGEGMQGHGNHGENCPMKKK